MAPAHLPGPGVHQLHVEDQALCVLGDGGDYQVVRPVGLLDLGQIALPFLHLEAGGRCLRVQALHLREQRGQRVRHGIRQVGRIISPEYPRGQGQHAGKRRGDGCRHHGSPLAPTPGIDANPRAQKHQGHPCTQHLRAARRPGKARRLPYGTGSQICPRSKTQGLGQFPGGPEALGGIFRQADPEDAAQGRGQAFGIARDFRTPCEDGPHGLHRGGAAEGVVPCSHLPQNHTQAEEIAAGIYVLTPDLFGAHVVGGSHHQANLRDPAERWAHPRTRCGLWWQGLILAQFHQPEIEDLHMAVDRQHQVLRLEIPVDDALVMGGGEPIRHGRGQLRCLTPGHGPCGHAPPQRRALHQLHHQVGKALMLAGVEDLHHVGVGQGGQSVDLPLETSQPHGIPGKGFRQDLDRHLPAQLGVPGPEHLTHTTHTKGTHDFVGTDEFANHKRAHGASTHLVGGKPQNRRPLKSVYSTVFFLATVPFDGVLVTTSSCPARNGNGHRSSACVRRPRSPAGRG